MPEIKTFQFEIVTPERLVLRESVSQVSLPTQLGEISILPDHIPLVGILKAGVIEVVKENGDKEILSVSSGFIEVLARKVVLLADTAETAGELDEERIKQARLRATELKQQTSIRDKVAFADASAMLEKELARSKALKRWRKLK